MPNSTRKSPRRKAPRAPYEVVASLAPGLVRIASDDFGFQLWIARKKRARSIGCSNCRKPIERGATCFGELKRVFKNRAHRVCARCISGQILRGLPRAQGASAG